MQTNLSPDRKNFGLNRSELHTQNRNKKIDRLRRTQIDAKNMFNTRMRGRFSAVLINTSFKWYVVYNIIIFYWYLSENVSWAPQSNNEPCADISQLNDCKNKLARYSGPDWTCQLIRTTLHLIRLKVALTLQTLSKIERRTHSHLINFTTILWILNVTSTFIENNQSGQG